jgi:hypothetical protein
VNGRFASLLTLVLLPAACGKPPYVPPEGIPQLFEVAIAAPELYEESLEGCVQVHHVWKTEVRAVHRTARRGVRERVRMLVDSTYSPYAAFWQGYVSNGFKGWARRNLDLVGDTRSAVPTQFDFLSEVTEVTTRVEEMTGSMGCAEWYLIYGPGWANLGGLSDGRMLLDFFGLPADDALGDIRRTLPHEVGHIIRRGPSHDPGTGTVLGSIIEEGFASYFADLYFGEEMTGRQSLGYSEVEWQWALDHEEELWDQALSELQKTDRDVIMKYRSAGAHLIPEGPPKVGYFIGYRIVQAYLERHGLGSLPDLLVLPVGDILDTSGYSP